MNTIASSGGQERKSYSGKASFNAHSGTSCSFCWFVLMTYPTLKSMTLNDEAAFKEHLRKAHGLRSEIQP